MYVPWPYGDETLIVDEDDTALLKWHRMKTDGCIPQYALHFIKRELFRQGLSVGHPVNDDEHDDDNFNHQNSDRRGSREDREDDDEMLDHATETNVAVAYQPGAHLDCRGVQYGITAANEKQCQEFISDWKSKLSREAEVNTQLSASEAATRAMDPNAIIRVPNHEDQQDKLSEMYEKLNVEQRFVFDSVQNHILDTTNGQLVGFVTGEGGTGKSTLIAALKVWTHVIFGKQEGALGACALCAPTGPAAFNIGGDTWHSAFSRGAEKSFLTSLDEAKNVERLRSKFKGMQLLIFDEISMIGARALNEIHLRCQLACNDDERRDKPFGGYHVLFWGVSTFCSVCVFMFNCDTLHRAGLLPATSTAG
jgi:primosomal protein N'